MRGIDTAISGLAPSSQDELRRLFALLALPPARLAIARVSEPWNRASEAEGRACLDRFRGSSLALLRSAYGALHQLTFAAWYGNPASWPRIGYPGLRSSGMTADSAIRKSPTLTPPEAPRAGR